MNADDVRLALREVAEDAPEGSPAMAEQAWFGGQRLRRRRSMTRIGLAAASTVAVCGAMLVVVSGGEPAPNLPVAPPATTTVRPEPLEVTWTLPPKSAEKALPLLPTELPGLVDPDPDLAVPLASDPVRRALAMFQADRDAPVIVLGDDGRLRRFDVEPIVSENAEPYSALREGSLSPDGRSAAIPQTDELLIVDLTTGGTRRLAVPGVNERVQWHATKPQQLLVGHDRRSFRVDLTTGKWFEVRGEQVVLLGDLDTTMPASPPIDSWWGETAMRGDRIARAAFDQQGNAVVVVLNITGVRDRVLASPIGDGRWKGGTRVLRWHNDSTVLLISDGERPMVLAWNVETGAIHRVMEVQRRASLTL